MDWFLGQLRLDWLIVGALLFFAGWSAWSDLRTGKIPNAVLQRLLLASVVWMWVLAISVGVFEHELDLIRLPVATSLPAYFLIVARNVGVALAIGVILWLARLWAAGDAKLFALVVLALPLRFYNRNYVDMWPAFVLLYNYVLATFIVIIGDLVWRLALAAVRLRQTPREKDENRPPLRTRVGKAVRENASVAGRFALMLILVFMFIKVLRHFARDALGLIIELDETILYLVLFFTCHPIVHFLSRSWALIGVAAIDVAFLVLAVFTDWIPGLTVSVMYRMSGVAAVLLVFRMAYDTYQARMDFTEVDVDDLAPKMILGDETMRTLLSDKNYFTNQELELGPLLPDGLHPEQVPLVQRWLRERMPGKAVQIQKTFPMAPTIFLGVLFTLLTKTYIIQLPR